jgi:phosphoribosylamine--glycine ligase
MNILVVGSGGREHALGWKIKQSPRCTKLYFAPGNGGTAALGENVAIKADDVAGLVAFAASHAIELTMVGPEVALSAGVVDAFDAAGLKACGPVKAAAHLEASKVFCKQVMTDAGVPTAAYEVFTDAAQAKAYVTKKGAPIVVKADGLCAGKGVVVASSVAQAHEAIDEMLVKKVFGKAGETIVIEDCLKGEEASVFAFIDASAVVPMVVAQDHKRIFDDDKGPNTGGMGAYAPAPVVTPAMFARMQREVFEPMRKTMLAKGVTYRGILFAGLMIDGDDYGVLEFNARFGDPETEVLMPKLTSDLVDILEAICDDRLATTKVEFDDDFCMTVVIASAGYPASADKGRVIHGLFDAGKVPGVQIFHAGTTVKDGQAVTDGGRVLAVTAKGKDFYEARRHAYHAVERICFEGMQFRKDIGAKAVKYL